jgi:hypothetical protein
MSASAEPIRPTDPTQSAEPAETATPAPLAGAGTTLPPEQSNEILAVARLLAHAEDASRLDGTYQGFREVIAEKRGRSASLPDVSDELFEHVRQMDEEREALTRRVARMVCEVEEWDLPALRDGRERLESLRRRASECCRTGVTQAMEAAGFDRETSREAYMKFVERLAEQEGGAEAPEQRGLALIRKCVAQLLDEYLLLTPDEEGRVSVHYPELDDVTFSHLGETFLLDTLQRFLDAQENAAQVERDATNWAFSRYAARKPGSTAVDGRAQQWLYIDRPFTALGNRTVIEAMLAEPTEPLPPSREQLAKEWDQARLDLYWVEANEDGTARYTSLLDEEAPAFNPVLDSTIREPHQRSGLAIARLVPLWGDRYTTAVGADFFPRVRYEQALEIARLAWEIERGSVPITLAVEAAVSRSVLKLSAPRRVRPSDGTEDARERLPFALQIFWEAGLVKTEDGRTIETEGEDSLVPREPLVFHSDVILRDWMVAMIEDAEGTDAPGARGRTKGAGRKAAKKKSKRGKSR